jgi:hypothetical protein
MAAALEQVATNVPERVRAALALRAQGKSWRAVATTLGLSDHIHLYSECRSHDAAMRGDERWKALTHQAMDLAQEAGAQLAEALLEGKISASQLPVVYGITADKVVNMRRAEQAQVSDTGSLVGEVLGRLQAAGGGSAKVTLEIETGPAAIEAEIVSG